MEQALVVENKGSVLFIRFPDEDRSKAWLIYEIKDGRMRLLETYTPPRYRGRGVARRLVEKAIELARSRGLVIEPVCSYTIYYFWKHPEARDVLAEEFRGLSDGDWERLFREARERESSQTRG